MRSVALTAIVTFSPPLLAGEVPIVVPYGGNANAGAYRLVAGQRDPLAAQVFEQGGKRYLAVIVPDGEKRSELAGPLAALNSSTGGVMLKSEGDRVRVTLNGDALLTEYRAADGPKPYFWPLIGPAGKPVTRAFPMDKVEGEDTDHNHQRSFWFTHGNVNDVDFWASDPLNRPSPNFGSIKETSRAVASGPVVGVLKTTDDWLGPDGKRICQDERVVRFYNTTDTRIIDFDITIKATDGPVTFKDTKEGMFGLRVASSMDVKNKQGGKITNAEGITDTAAWGKASPWVDYTGPVDGQIVGIAILNHPSSFRYPTTWHVRDYGLFAANPFGWHDFGMGKSGEHTIPKGESITFRYRVLVHPGDTSAAHVADAFRAYADPIAVKVVE
jgi:hypothetical protein